MKTKLCLALILVLFSTFPVLATAQTTESRLTKLEERITNIEKMFAAIMQLKDNGDNPEKQAAAPQDKPLVPACKLKLTDWNYKHTKGSHQDYYTITYALTNEYDKGIKLIKGGIIFRDLLGEKLYSIKITPDEKISPDQTITDTGKYRINRFMPDQLRMKDMSKGDILPALELSKIVFADNSILDL